MFDLQQRLQPAIGYLQLGMLDEAENEIAALPPEVKTDRMVLGKDQRIMIKAIIFDLDNCLAAANEVGEQLFAPAFTAMRQANRGMVSEKVLLEAFADCWRHPLDWVAVRHGFSDEMLAAGWRIFETTEVVDPMHGYGDLALLPELPTLLFLVTSGFRHLQESKVRALGIGSLFAAVHIDAIDEPGRKGKQGLFAEILSDGGFKVEEVLVVGDSSHSEIEAGNRLGIRTVQILRPGVPRGDNATFHIRDLAGLKDLLTDLNERGG